MIIRKLALIIHTWIIVSCGICLAEDFVVSAEQLRCSATHMDVIEIIGQQKAIKIPHFASTLLLSQSDVCKAFLRQLVTSLPSEKMIHLDLKKYGDIVSSINPSQSNLISKFRSRFLESKCHELGYCSWIPYFGVRDEIRSCNPTFSFGRYLRRIMPAFQRPNYRVIPKVDIEFFPFLTLADHLAHRAGQESLLFASTMSIGATTAESLFHHLNYMSKTKVFVAADAALLLEEKDSKIPVRFARSSVLLFVPILRSSEFSTIYHWKMVVDSTQSMITSMNLSNPLNFSYIDALYLFDDPEIRRELESLLINSMKDSCEFPEDFDCMIQVKVPDVGQQVLWRELQRKSCAALEQVEVQSSIAQPRFFMTPHETDIQLLVEEMIAAAKEEVVLISHQARLIAIENALKNAEARGVRVILAVGSDEDYSKLMKQRYASGLRQAIASGGRIAPHMKAVIIDRKKMFFGTGNFTNNAFFYAQELFAVTDDQKAIKKSLAMVASVIRTIDKKSGELLLDDYQPETQLIIWPCKEGKECELVEQASELPKHAWMESKYRVVKPELRNRLRECKLDKYFFLFSREIIDCLKSP